MARILMVLMSFVLIGCGSGGTPITDFSNRSVAYTWIDVSKISGNHLFAAEMRMYAPESQDPFYSMGIEKMEGGYLIWHNGFEPGKYEFERLSLQSCLTVICGNTINEYEFGPFGSAPGKINVGRPGVYFGGCYALVRTKRAWFGNGEFDTVRTKCKPSKRQMLTKMLEYAPEAHPIVAKRIRAAM